MKKAKLSFLMLFLTLVLSSCFSTSQNEKIKLNRNIEGEVMNNVVENEYQNLVNSLENLPVSFVYDNTYYYGLNPDVFEVISKNEDVKDKITTTKIELKMNEILGVEVIFNYYKNHNAYDYVVYFKNISRNENSGVIEKLYGIDIEYMSKSAVLTGNKGDYDYLFAPYEYDLTKEDIKFVSTRGRATHTDFPYFDLQLDNGGYKFALGWAGTWNASFSYNSTKGSVTYKGASVNNLCTYLKPGEKIRTPLVFVMKYESHDRELNTNLWRNMMFDVIYPRENAKSDKCVPAMSCSYFAFDNNTSYKAQTDGSAAENYQTWENSLRVYKEHGMKSDIHWFDAGWYKSPNNRTSREDWWGNVGTWELDPIKWPNMTFNDYVNAMHSHGEKVFVWFEIERGTHIDDMVNFQDFNYDWAISINGRDNAYLNNLGDPECLDYLTNKVLSFMNEYDIDVYREDFNFDPGNYWKYADALEGKNRIGITENKYIQGHYELWDRIIANNKKYDKPTYVDGCASGGGRMDIESMKRSISFVRSDSEASGIGTKLAITTRLTNWLPWFTSGAKYASSYTTEGPFEYDIRADYSCFYNPQPRYSLDEARLDWDMLKRCNNEFNEIKQFFFKDFYVLTPDHGTTTDEWTAYMFFDKANDKGVVQAFRQRECDKEEITLKIKGVDDNKTYNIRDIDGMLSQNNVKGSTLKEGFNVSANQKGKAIVLYIESV